MPLTTINITEGMAEEAIDQLQSTIHSCFVKAWGIPMNGGFYIINERPKSRMRISRTMWGIHRSDQPTLLLQITSSPRSSALKVELFRVLAEELEKQGVRKEDLFISITPTQPEDWSFGNGVGQFSTRGHGLKALRSSTGDVSVTEENNLASRVRRLQYRR